MASTISMRDAFFNRIYELARKDRNLIVISCDMGAPALDNYRRDLAPQFVNVGIAEQNGVTVATGLALCGKKPYVYAIMPFATLRPYELIKVDCSLMNLPVTIVGVGSGFSYDDSGPTHHSTEDLGPMRSLPNMTVLNASDSVMAAKFADISYNNTGPGYVRLDREVLPAIYGPKENFAEGLAVHRHGKDVCIIATGNMLHRALEVADRLKARGIAAGVVDLYRIKPLNHKTLVAEVKKSKRVITMEEHVLDGGMGSAVLEALADNNVQKPVRRFGIPNRYYYAYGGRANIQKICGLDAERLTGETLAWLY